MRKRTRQEQNQDLINLKEDLSKAKNIVLVDNAYLGRNSLEKITKIMNDKNKPNAIKHEELRNMLHPAGLEYEVSGEWMRIYERGARI